MQFLTWALFCCALAGSSPVENPKPASNAGEDVIVLQGRWIIVGSILPAETHRQLPGSSRFHQKGTVLTIEGNAILCEGKVIACFANDLALPAQHNEIGFPGFRLLMLNFPDGKGLLCSYSIKSGKVEIAYPHTTFCHRGSGQVITLQKETLQSKTTDTGQSKRPKLNFREEGNDLIVSCMIEGPAARQVVVTSYRVDDGRAKWDEPPIGVEKPRQRPSVTLCCTVLINESVPGYHEGGLMTPPTPVEIRQRGRQEVSWRLRDFLKQDFKKEDAFWNVDEHRLALTSDQWREALPKIQNSLDSRDVRQNDRQAPLPSGP